MKDYYMPGEGNLTKWDVYFALYLAMLHARDRVEYLKRPEAIKATYDFIIESYKELENKLPEVPDREIFLKSMLRER